jgi:hypothetical protein
MRKSLSVNLGISIKDIKVSLASYGNSLRCSIDRGRLDREESMRWEIEKETKGLGSKRRKDFIDLMSVFKWSNW